METREFVVWDRRVIWGEPPRYEEVEETYHGRGVHMGGPTGWTGVLVDIDVVNGPAAGTEPDRRPAPPA